MMTFYHIVNVDRFFEVIDACAGGIFFQASESQYVDIRHNDLIKKLLEISCSRHGVERLDLYIESIEDQAILLRYMMDCHCKSSICNK